MATVFAYADTDANPRVVTSGYVMMFNLPGRLPEMAPEHHGDFPGAVEALVAELETQEINAPSDAMAERFCALADDVAAWTEPSSVTGPDGYVYSVQKVIPPIG